MLGKLEDHQRYSFFGRPHMSSKDAGYGEGTHGEEETDEEYVHIEDEEEEGEFEHIEEEETITADILGENLFN